MIKKNILLLLFIGFYSVGVHAQTTRLNAQDGFLDVSDKKFTDGEIVRLDGEWEFYWGKLLSPKDFQSLDLAINSNNQDQQTKENKQYFKLPYVWNGHKINDKVLKGDGYATFRLRLKIGDSIPALAIRIQEQATAFKLYANGTLVAQSGKVGTSKIESIPHTVPQVAYLPSISNKLVLILQISNFHHKNGGVWHSIYMGNHEDIQNHVRQIRGLDTFLFGILFIMILYHIGLFAIRRKDNSAPLFALYCFVVLLRSVSTGEKLIVELMPFLTYSVYVRVEYISWFFSLSVAYHFIQSLFEIDCSKNLVKIFYIVSLLFTIFTLFFPTHIFSHLSITFQMIFLIKMIITTFYLILAIVRKRKYSIIVSLGFFIPLIAAINDILYTNQIIRTGFLIHYALLFLVFAESLVLSLKFSEAFRNEEKLTHYLKQSNEVFSKFVPQEFLGFLNHSNISDIRLGDEVQKDMTILFSDIRSFTEMSESMTPKEIFLFINTYLKRMEPIVKRYNGFIDKFIGDSIMALYPQKIENAVDSAILMQKSLSRYNTKRVKKGYREINIGIGIHSGNLILGTIGSEQRMEATVISDAVNLASRLEGLTKLYRAKILISAVSLSWLVDPNRYNFRMLGKVKVKGKKEKVAIFEILDGYSFTQLALFKKSLPEFEKAIIRFASGEYKDAEELFQKVLEINPEDGATAYYLDRCQSGSIE